MFESQTFEKVLARLLAEVPADLDKREGSVIYNALAPAALEMSRLYIGMDDILNETFADTASRYYLVKRAQERGIYPRSSTFAVLKGVFDTEIPIGSRFSGGGMNYIITERMDEEAKDVYYRLSCETPGSSGNGYTGVIVPIDDGLNGLTRAELLEVLLAGEDAEGTEEFRARYFASITSQAFGGNKADYIEKVSTLDYVGAAKVYPVWNGGGTVKIVIVDSGFGAPSEESGLIEKVQNEIDPPPNQGQGMGIAPIGHVVTVEGATEDIVDVQLQCAFETGYEWDDIKESVQMAIENYFFELNRNWTNSETGIVVRVSYIESKILDVQGVQDVTVTINHTSGNYQTDDTSVVKLGEVTSL